MRSKPHHDIMSLLIQDQPVSTIEDPLHSSFPKELNSCSVGHQKISSHQKDDDRIILIFSPTSASKHIKTEPIRKKSEPIRKKSVVFSNTVKYREIPHRNDLPEGLKALIWECPRSLRRIRRDGEKIASILNFGLEVKEECGQRGLYNLLYPEKQKRADRREVVYNEMYLLQEMQDDFRSLFDEKGGISELVARRYASLCEQSRCDALARAREDETVLIQ